MCGLGRVGSTAHIPPLLCACRECVSRHSSLAFPVRLAIGSPKGTNGLPCHPPMAHPTFFVRQSFLTFYHRNMMSTLSSHSTSSRMLHAVLARRPSRPFWSPRLPLESSCWSHILTAEPCSSPSLLKYIEGHIFRAPKTLRFLTLCNCDCKVITAVCFGLRRYSIECMVRCNSIDSPKWKYS